MDLETKKLGLIEQVLRLEDDAIIEKLTQIIEKGAQNRDQKEAVYNLLGVITAKEAAKMKKEIADSCETIDENEW